MKKLSGLAVILAAAAVLFTACSKTPKIDSSKWIDNLEDGLTAAAKENKRVFVFFSVDDQDGISADLKSAVFNTEDFISSKTADFVLVNLDYSNSLFEEIDAKQNGTEEEQKEAEALSDKIQRNMVTINMYNVESSPAFYILSKEGYVESILDITSEDDTLEAVNNKFEEKKASLESFDNLLAATAKGSKSEKVQAIDALFEAAAPQLRQVLTPLSEQLVKLDPKNESGFVGKHVIAIANAKAIRAYVQQDPETASAEFVKAGDNQYVSAEDRQGAYYTAGYLLAQSGSQDYQAIKDLFQKSYDAAPESEHAAQIKQMMGFVA